MTRSTQKITPNLWFDDRAEEATGFYAAIFDDSGVGNVSRYDESSAAASGRPVGSAMTVPFELEGQGFLALNGGPRFTFTPAISFIVRCPTRDDVDELWARLSDDGDELMPLDSYPFSERYGWTEDRYGVSWQLIFADGTSEREIVPSLMFVGDRCGRAEEAIELYTSVFGDSAVGDIARYGPDQPPNEEGTVTYAEFTLEGQRFAAMDSAMEHDFTFNEAVSLVVNCETQEEVDSFWNALSADPDSERCGWLKDEYGVSWQIVPTVLPELLDDPDAEKSRRVMEAMLGMKKLDIGALEGAYAG